MTEDKNKILNVEAGCLCLSCYDSVEVIDRTTFDSYVVDGLQVTFWLEDDAEERVNKMFDMFFDELVKTGNQTILSVLE